MSHSFLQIRPFFVGSRHMAVPASHVADIVEWSGQQSCGMAAHVIGKVERHGCLYPVIDLSSRLGWAPATAEDRQIVLLLQNRDLTQGYLIDWADQLLHVFEELREPVPAGCLVNPSDLAGIAVTGARRIEVLDVDRLMSDAPTSRPLAA